MSRQVIGAVEHDELAGSDLRELRRLFDAEYYDDFGEWDPGQPYGYVSHDTHVVARVGDRLIGHVGWARREIIVGGRTVVIAGIGGVLVCEQERGRRLGAELMRRAAQSIRDHDGIACGSMRRADGPASGARERRIGRDGEPPWKGPGLLCLYSRSPFPSSRGQKLRMTGCRSGAIETSCSGPRQQ